MKTGWHLGCCDHLFNHFIGFFPPQIPDYNYQQKTATVEEIAQIQSELDRMERERRHYIEMGKKNSGSRNGTLCGHYMRRVSGFEIKYFRKKNHVN